MTEYKMKYLNLEKEKKIRYELIEGEINYPYLVFLHEGLGCIEMWKDFPQRLCQKTECPGLLYDRSGYGHSSGKTKRRDIRYLEDYALDELPEIMQELLPGKKYILIGHSDGGSISLIYASRAPEYLLGIVVEAAHVFVEPETISGIRSAVAAYEKIGPGKLSRYHGENAPAVFRAWSETWLSEWFSDWNIVSLLSSITCPALVIQGQDDSYGTERQVETIVRKVRGRTSHHLLPGCGHTPHLEQPELVCTLMADFALGLM